MKIATVKNIGIRILFVLLAIQFIFQGGQKLIRSEYMQKMFVLFGYGHSSWQMVVVGMVEVVGGIALLLPRFRFWSAISLFVMLVILMSDVFHRVTWPLEPEIKIVLIPALVTLVILLLITWFLRPNFLKGMVRMKGERT
jgi:uncharacterized membrane protein YphA (DoxX/SURF4 family)